MKCYSLIIALFLAFNAFSQNIVCFTIQPNPNPTDQALNIFSKYIDVYGCSIYAQANVADEKVLHAAAIWAELIDNNEDGVVDDPLLHTELVNNGAMIPIFNLEDESIIEEFFYNYNGNGISAVLWQSEMDPSQPGHWGSDATVEEILHTINHIGHVNIYPEAFSLSPNSSLMTAAMDTARGGQFFSIPSPYPLGAWYHYDDATCDYECMAIEYMYWSIVSLMGILDDPVTCAGISNEWELCSPSLFQSTDALMYNLITDASYKLPQIAPNGNYCPSLLSVVSETDSEKSFYIFPNPVNNHITINRLYSDPAFLSIFNMQGQQVDLVEVSNKSAQIGIGKLASGVYNIILDNSCVQFIKK